MKLTRDPAVAERAVTFQGYLSALDDGKPLAGGIYRFFTSPWHDEYMEIKGPDLLYQQKMDDGSSVVWVKRDALIVKCQAAEACHFAEQQVELGSDPTAANPAGAKYPKHG